MGKIGVLVALESDAGKEKLDEIGRKVAMHIAASTSLHLTKEQVPSEKVAKEREILLEQARQQNPGKPEEMIAKMVDGRMKKFYEEIVLLEQPFVMDSKMKVLEFVENEAKALGHPVKIVDFKKFIVGEGVEKKVVDFAAEVAAVTKG
jgi:elongation factor Ts